MDGFYDFLADINLTEAIQRLAYEQYDTDALLEDVSADMNLHLSPSNVVSFIGDTSKSKAISNYIYLSKRM